MAPIPSSSHSQFLIGCRIKQSKRLLTSAAHTGAAAMDSQRGLHSIATPAAGTDPPKTPHIAVYSGGILAWGEKPPCFDVTVQPRLPPVWIP
jgi:hypothetical protein